MEEIVGLDYDAHLGFRRNYDAVVEVQKRFVEAHPDPQELTSLGPLDAKLFFYDTGRMETQIPRCNMPRPKPSTRCATQVTGRTAA